jgi:hypothetical protein
VFLLPFTWMPIAVGMPIFVGLSIGLFTFAVTRDSYWRISALLSAPIVYSILGAQVVPLVVAAMLLPWLHWLVPMKFTLGAAGAAYTSSQRSLTRYVVSAAVPLLVSIAIWPWWPLAWYRELTDVADRYYDVPIMVLGGVLVLFAALRWRRPEARLLLVMACLPQTMYNYDQLPLVLIPATRVEMLAFALLTHIPRMANVALYGDAVGDRAQLFRHLGPLIVACYYLPALVMVLRRPNEGLALRWPLRRTVTA